MGNLLRVLYAKSDDNLIEKIDIFVDFESKFKFMVFCIFCY